ncbi:MULTISPECIES: ribosome biogenesis GTP-binding protein YihA/YsxC [unclassified Robertmurraya]|jgi:GTP-binding protein|uniref:ribosome biogenesis GTP-binding protein YihA/YsxC n=1 Tax=unclassified Robertmurraya TaxID=2837524 RepID=UPI000E6B0E72|nr:ribosome biogenesis GTP-binding protein YihA/YsxC [Bacillus sp. Y1]AYA77193.1 YihA family ribosome biogenesis GTP-binding protein [Bacillus sp. Y1]
MKVTSSEIVISAVKPDQYPVEPIPEFALAGRSNVGKSSFINKMLNRKGLARISSKPGKTQTLNFYIVNEVLHFVDVPGYGYAKVSKKEREAWGKMLETYLTMREQLKAVLLIVDLRHPPTADDIMMYDFLKHYEIPCIVIATKADKISKTKRAQHLKITKEKLELHPHDTIIQFSSETGEGKDKAWATIESYM